MIRHRLLLRQIRKHLGPDAEIPPGMKALLHSVEEAYEQFDVDRRLVEHAMDVSSAELMETNELLRRQNDHQREILARLRGLVRALDRGGEIRREADDGDDVPGLISLIDELVARRNIAEENLRTARDTAEAASHAKSDFLAGMSHEIRTPINAVVGKSRSLLDEDLTLRQRELAASIHASADALHEIISEILDLSKMEAGRLELDVHPFDLHACVESIVDLFALRCIEKGVDLGLDIASDVPVHVEADDTRLRQILVNLVGNAVKFTECGGVSVSVAARRTSDRCVIVFVVEDTGAGVPKDRLEQLFKSASQAGSAGARLVGGAGLGLAISQRLVMLMGGEIRVETREGIGSRFEFTIPVSTPAGTSVDTTSPDLSGKRVLVIDPSAITRGALRRQVETWGACVFDTSTESEALAHFDEAGGFDLGLLGAHAAADLAPTSLHARLVAAGTPIVLLEPYNKIGTTAGSTTIARLAQPVKPRDLATVCRQTLRHDETDERADRDYESSFDPDFARRHPFRVLVVDDNPSTIDDTLHALSRLGYRPDTATGGAHALESLAHQAYDLVLMDAQMSELDGLEVTRRLRSHTPPTEPPYVLAVIVSTRPETRTACLDAGMHNILTKPVRLEALRQALAEAHGWLCDRAPVKAPGAAS